tara:strand:+ start:1404 stop:1592 length:189 start_codon:yes stop_codon:yes gene_type:complete
MAASDYFKKFMDSFEKKDTQKKERLKNYAEEHGDSPQRKYNDLYRERWQNRITYRLNRNVKK